VGHFDCIFQYANLTKGGPDIYCPAVLVTKFGRNDFGDLASDASTFGISVSDMGAINLHTITSGGVNGWPPSRPSRQLGSQVLTLERRSWRIEGQVLQ